MEITIGMQNIARELVLETDQTADAVAKAVRKSLETGTPVELTDSRGRKLIIPDGVIGYIEIGAEARPVGFHSL